jgi:hypothetical protein
MKNNLLTLLLLLLSTSMTIMISSCKKDFNSVLSVIDVSAQWETLDVYEITDSLNDGQWRPKVFTQSEIDLFKSLDTTNLTGTSAPDSLLSNPFPICSNPFDSVTALPLRFSNNYAGQFVCKYVIIDSLFNPIIKASERVQANRFVDSITYLHSFSIGVLIIRPKLPIGRYRMYYTLSAEGNQIFYKTWGNIRRVIY